MWENANTNLSFLLYKHSMKMLQRVRLISCQHYREPRENHSLLKEQIRNIIWVFIILTHPSVLQELDFIIYTRGEGHDILGQAQREG